jgi:hypothetical protein
VKRQRPVEHLFHFVEPALDFQSYVVDPENTVRWKWRLGDVAMWDNRATQHRSVPDFGDAPRRLRRATVLGTVGQSHRRTVARLRATIIGPSEIEQRLLKADIRSCH